MIIKYCRKCPGRPYTSNFQVEKCPRCGSELSMESVDESELEGRPQLNIPANNDARENNEEHPRNNEGNGTWENNPPVPQRERGGALTPVDEGVVIPTTQKGNSQSREAYVPEKTIRGKILQYSSSGKEDGQYRRLLPARIFQALVYNQRLEDVLHRFTVRVDQGRDALGYDAYTDVPVNVHGTVAGGIQLTDNAEVEVRGKYRNGVLMASEIYVINNGYSSKVRFQHSVSAIVNSILLAIMACILCYIGIASDAGFFESIGQFCKVWGIAAVIFLVLYLIANLTKIGLLINLMSKKEKKFPLMGILVVSFACAFLFIAAFGSIAGFGSYLSGLAMSILPVVILIIAAFFLLKALIGV